MLYAYLKKWKEKHKSEQLMEDYWERPGRSGKKLNGASKNGKHCWNMRMKWRS